MLEALREVYKNDAITRKQKMSPQERLCFHQAHSAKVMANLKRWLEDQLDPLPPVIPDIRGRGILSHD